MDKVLDYIKESKTELKRVTWPTKQQVWKATLVVVVLTTLMGLYLGLVDGILTYVFEFGFSKFFR